MAEFEQKTLVRAQENASTIDKELKRLTEYGWVVVDKKKETAENNSVEYIYLQRDLSIPQNNTFKEIEEEEDDVHRAMEYCDSYQYFLNDKLEELRNERRFKPALFIILIAYALFQIVGATLLVYVIPKYADQMRESGAEVEIVDMDGELVFPEGMTLFGMHSVNYKVLILTVCYAIGALIIFVALLLLISKLVKRRILRDQKEEYEKRRNDFILLKQNLSKWTKHDAGAFNPYAFGEFKTIR